MMQIHAMTISYVNGCLKVHVTEQPPGNPVPVNVMRATMSIQVDQVGQYQARYVI